MPIYEIRTPDGKILEVEGDRMPTETELHSITSELFPQKARMTPYDRPVLGAEPTLPEFLSQPGLGTTTPEALQTPEEFGLEKGALGKQGTAEVENLAYQPPKPAAERPETGSTSMWGNVIGEIFAPTPSVEARDRAEQTARAAASLSTSEMAQKYDRIQREYRRRLQMAAPFLQESAQPGETQRVMASIDQWYKDSLANIGITPVDITERPRVGEPLTQAQQETLLGKSATAETVGAAQRMAQGFATTLVQPEMLPMAPGAAGMEMALAKRAFAKTGVPQMAPGMIQTGKLMAESMLPGMAEQTIASGSQALGHLMAGDPKAAITPAVDMFGSGLMMAIPIQAARRRSRMLRQAGEEAKGSLTDRLDTLEEDIFNRESGDPDLPRLRQERADLQDRLDKRVGVEQQVLDAAKKLNRKVVITDDPIGEGELAVAEKDGTIRINRDVLHNFLEHDLGGKITDQAIESLINQESIHGAQHRLSRADARHAAYWNSLSKFEKALEAKLYNMEGLSDAQKGFEVARRRIEMLNGMAPLELLSTAKVEQWSNTGWAQLSDLIGATRRLLSKESRIQELSVLDRIQANMDKMKGAPDALESKAAPVLRPVREPSREGQQAVPVTEAGPKDDAGRRALTGAQQRVVQAQVLLTPREQSQLQILTRLGSRGERLNPSQQKLYDRLTRKSKSGEPMEGEIVEAAAYVDAEGNIHSGPNHPSILQKLGITGLDTRESRNTPEFGYVTNRRPFVGRELGGEIAKKSGQDLETIKPGEKVHSDKISSPKQPDIALGDSKVAPKVVPGEPPPTAPAAGKAVAPGTAGAGPAISTPTPPVEGVQGEMPFARRKPAETREIVGAPSKSGERVYGFLFDPMGKGHNVYTSEYEGSSEKGIHDVKAREISGKNSDQLFDQGWARGIVDWEQKTVYIDTVKGVSLPESTRKQIIEFAQDNGLKAEWTSGINTRTLWSPEDVLPAARRKERDPSQHLDYSPEDLRLYVSLKDRMDELLKTKPHSQEYMDTWASYEQLRNKYNGNPPKQLVQPITEPASPLEFVPALRTKEGEVIKGGFRGTHNDIYASLPGIVGAELRLEQPEHGFMFRGEFKTRKEVSGLLGEKEPMQSERLLELQDKIRRKSEELLPAARRGKWRPLRKEQLPLGLETKWVYPGEKKDITGGVVSRAPAEVAAPEGTPPMRTPAELLAFKAEQLASAPVEVGTRKSRKVGVETPERTVKVKDLDDLLEWAKNNIGPGIGRTELLDRWKDAVYNDLVHATPDRLAELVDAYDLCKKLGLRRDPETGKVDPAFIPAEEGKEVFRLEPLKPGEKAKIKPKRKEGTIYRAGEKRASEAEMRARVISAVAEVRLEETLPHPQLDRTSITLDDIDFSNPDTHEGAYRKISADEARNPDVLLRVLRDEARTKGQPVSNTRRLVVLHNPQTGEVELVSTYNDAGRQMVVDPFLHGVGKEKSNIPLDAKFLKRYTPIGSILLSYPVKNFRQKFAKVKDFATAIEKQAMELEKARSPFPGEDVTEPTTAKEQEQKELDYWREELRGVAEKQEQGTPTLEGEGGGLQGPAAREARLQAGLAPGEIAKSYREPLTASEAESIYKWIESEFGDPARPDDPLYDFSLDDMFGVIKGLADLASQPATAHYKPRATVHRFGKSQKKVRALTAREIAALPSATTSLKGIHRKVISALQKIADSIYEGSYDSEMQDYRLTTEEAYKMAIQEIYNNLSESAESGNPSKWFREQLLTDYGPAKEEPTTVPGVAQTAPKALGVTRELTMPSGKWSFKRRPIPGGAVGRPGERPGSNIPKPPPEPPAQLTAQERAYVESQSVLNYRPTSEMSPEELPGYTPPKPEGRATGVKLITKRPAFMIKRTKPFELKAEGEAGKAEEELILGPETRMELPAARRKMQALSDTYTRVIGNLSDSAKRRTVLRDIPRTLDGLESTSAIMTQEAVNAIRLASTKGLEDYIKKRKLVPDAINQLLATRAQSQEARNYRSGAIAMLATIKKPTRKERRAAARYAKKYGEPLIEKTPQPSLSNINALISKADVGIMKANQLMARTNPADKWVGRRYLNAALKLRKMAEFARDHWNDKELQDTAAQMRKELKTQLANERANGMGTQEWFNYVPGLYEGELYNEDILNWGSWNVMGTNYRQAKKFGSYYDAIAAGPYIPASYDGGDIVGHRIRRGNYVIARRAWQTTLKGMRDPASGKKIAVEPHMYQKERPVIDPDTGQQKINEETGEKEFFTETGWTAPSNDYILIDPTSGERKNVFVGTKPIAIRKGYDDFIKACLSRSAVRNYAAGRAALHATSALKHGWILMLDSFHFGRLAQYAAAASPGNFQRIIGRESPGSGAGYKGGYSALSYRPEDLPAAVAKGLIDSKSLQWATEPIKVNAGKGRTVEMTRQQILREFVSEGLNAGRVADAIYKDVVRDIPGIGTYTKWLFDHFVPGLIAETAVRNFENANAKHPDIPVARLMKDIARDTNVTYGNMGRQGAFRDATLRDMMQLFLLAPQWREGLFQKDIRYMARMAATAEYGGRLALQKLGMNIDPSRGIVQKMTGREGLPPMGSLGAMVTRGLISYFALAQVINLISKNKFTWQNEEEGRKLDAFIPIGKDGVWLPTLGVFGEITGDVIRYGETKGNAYQQLLQVGLNSLGPSGKMANVLWTQETPRGEKLTTTGGILKGAASEMAPAPISLSTVTRGIGHTMAPGMVAPNEPGSVPQRVFGAVGMKVHRGIDPIVRIGRMAREWAKEQGLPPPTVQISATEEASLAKLRHAVKIGDESGAVILYNQLLDRYEKTPRGKGYEKYSPEDMVLRAMDLWRDRPFTGSNVKEDEFRSSLDEAGQEAYSLADQQRLEDHAKMVEFILKQPMR